MKDTLTNINNQSFNNFMLRIGKGTTGELSRPDLKGEGRLVGKITHYQTRGELEDLLVVLFEVTTCRNAEQ